MTNPLPPFVETGDGVGLPLIAEARGDTQLGALWDTKEHQVLQRDLSHWLEPTPRANS